MPPFFQDQLLKMRISPTQLRLQVGVRNSLQSPDIALSLSFRRAFVLHDGPVFSVRPRPVALDQRGSSAALEVVITLPPRMLRSSASFTSLAVAQKRAARPGIVALLEKPWRREHGV